MKIHILTCFPEFFYGTFCSLLGKAQNTGVLSFNVINLKKYAIGKHRKLDDTPYGGGDGLILMPEVIENALNDNFQINEIMEDDNIELILPSPRGTKLTHELATQFANYKEIIILCNRYEGVDQRAIEYYKMKEVCIGEYILMGGETAAMCIIESTARFVQGVIKNRKVLENETFSNAFIENIECGQYTKPREWQNLKVPEVLLSGNHAEIERWQKKINPATKKSN